MNDTTAISATLADFLARTHPAPAYVAQQTYSGPPAAPCILVRPLGEAKVDPISGRVSGAWRIAAYGTPLDLSGVVDGRGLVKSDVATTTTVGTLHSLTRGTLHLSHLPDGTEVQHFDADVIGYPWLPLVTAWGSGIGYEAYTAASRVAGAIADHLVEHRPGRTLTHGEVTVDAARYESGKVTAELFISPVRGSSLDGLDLDGLTHAACASVVGSVVSHLGRVLDVERGAMKPRQDGRQALGYTVPVVLTIGSRAAVAAPDAA